MLAASFTSILFSQGCLDSAIALRFRAAYAPRFAEGMSDALTNPDSAEAGLREAGAAFFDGLAAMIEPRSVLENRSSR
jgi:hypothetical protein